MKISAKLGRSTMDQDNTIIDNLAANLEEFGLSTYESRAYITIISHGSLSASEVAYYSSLPRTKIYLTLKKLEKKRLLTISQQKPLICSPVSPQEGFGELINLYDRRLKNMKKIIERLQYLFDESNYVLGTEEKKYFILEPKQVLENIKLMIENSRISLDIIIDSWGLQIITQCITSIIRSMVNGIKIRLLISPNIINNENLNSLPDGITIKAGTTNSNIIIIDSNKLITIDGHNGKAAIFKSLDGFGNYYITNFENEWINSSGNKININRKNLMK